MQQSDKQKQKQNIMSETNRITGEQIAEELEFSSVEELRDIVFDVVGMDETDTNGSIICNCNDTKAFLKKTHEEHEAFFGGVFAIHCMKHGKGPTKDEAGCSALVDTFVEVMCRGAIAAHAFGNGDEVSGNTSGVIEFFHDNIKAAYPQCELPAKEESNESN